MNARSDRVLRTLVPMGFAVAAITGTTVAGAGTASAAANVNGTVVCASGQQVVGIWVQASNGGSGFADFNRQPGAAHVAQYNRAVSSGGTVSLHIGCGGTASKWRGDNWTPATDIGNGRTVNTVCNDGIGTAVRCVLPTRGATRTTNWFSPSWCTDGAAQKLQSAIGAFPAWSGDAKDWATNAARAGWTVRPEAAARSIFVLQPGGGTSSSAGHVGWVDRVEYRPDGAYIHTTEMNARQRGQWTNEVRKVTGSDRFILVP